MAITNRTIRIDDGLWSRVAVVAAANGWTVSDLVRNLLAETAPASSPPCFHCGSPATVTRSVDMSPSVGDESFPDVDSVMKYIAEHGDLPTERTPLSVSYTACGTCADDVENYLLDKSGGGYGGRSIVLAEQVQASEMGKPGAGAALGASLTQWGA